MTALPEWTEAALHETLLGMAEARGMKNGTLLWPVRIALAGKQVTPGGAIEIAAHGMPSASVPRPRSNAHRLYDMITAVHETAHTKRRYVGV